MATKILSIISDLRSAVASLTPQARRTVALLSLLAVIINGGYSLTRPFVDAVFWTELEHKVEIPRAWAICSLFLIVLTIIYNTLAPRLRILTLLRGAFLLSFSVLVPLIVFFQCSPKNHLVILLLFLWKESYIVILIVIFWSFASLINKTYVAKWTYGLYVAAGASAMVFSSQLGSTLPQTFYSLRSAIHRFAIMHDWDWFSHAFPYPSDRADRLEPGILWMSSLLLPIGLYLSHTLAKLPENSILPPVDTQKVSFRSIKSIFKSRYLFILMLIVVLSQIVMYFIDQRQSGVLKNVYGIQEHSHFRYQMEFLLGICCLTLGLMTGPIIRFLGIAGPLLGTPILLFAAMIVMIFVPGLWPISIAFLIAKSSTYTIFNSAKEISYIPLSYDEKVEGKFVIDVLAYRLAKFVAAMAALLWPILTSIARADLKYYLIVVVGFMMCWIVATVILLRRYDQHTTKV